VRSEMSERGTTLSGGQQQRLRLARALAFDPPVLVLVEPTSAVDAHTEATIADRLRAARAGRTTVVITTSPLLLDRADQVAQFGGGRVVATGTHQELVRTNPQYTATVLREGG
jgi:ABC-type multidrug transport system fused ATPase/permease subunit